MDTQIPNSAEDAKNRNEGEPPKEGGAKTELTFINMWSSKAAFEKHSIEDLAKNFANLDLDDFRKEGFFLALSPEEEPLANRLLNEKVKERLQRGNSVKQQISLAVRAELGHGSQRKLFLQESRQPLQLQLDRQLAEIPVLQQKIEAIQLEIKTFTAQITAVNYALSRALTTLIPDRIEQLKLELAKLAECYDQIADAKSKTNLASYQQQKPKLDARLTRLKKAIGQAETELTDLEERLKGIEGVSVLGANWLFHLTASSIFVVGWLFSIYAGNRQIDSDDWLSYIMTSIQNAYLAASQKLDFWGPVVIFWGLLLALTSIAAGVRFIANRLDKKKIKVQDDNSAGAVDLNIDIGGAMKTTFSSEYSKGDFFSLWMKLFPAALILGTLFFIIIGLNSSDQKQFSASLSGQMAGVALALIATGLMYIYIFFVIEKRRKTTAPLSFWKANIELISSMIGLVLFVPMSFLYGQSDIVAIVAFGFVLIFFGLVMGYAIYFRSIRTRQWELQEQISVLNYRAEHTMVPTPLYALKSDGHEFRNHMALVQDQIYQLIEYRNHQALEATIGANISPKKIIRSFFGGSPVRALKEIYRWRAASKLSQSQNSALTNAQSQMLPQFKIMINELEDRRAILEKELKPLQEKYERLTAEGTDHVIALRQKIENINFQILENEGLLGALIKAQEVCFQNVEHAIIRQQYSLRDGFDLGLWQRRNGMDFKPPFLLH